MQDDEFIIDDEQLRRDARTKWLANPVDLAYRGELVELGIRVADEIEEEAARPAAAIAARIDKCNCEHTDHMGSDVNGNMTQIVGHAYMDAPAGNAHAHFVGRVCDDCAKGHMQEWLIIEEYML